MAGTCIARAPHDKCGSSDGVQVYEQEDGIIDGYCFACDTYVKDPYGSPKSIGDIPKDSINKKSEEEIKDEIETINSCSCIDLESRRLRKVALEYYGVKVGLSTYDGKTPTFVYFPYYDKEGNLVRYKVRLLQKKKSWNISLSKDVMPFGWEQAKTSGARKLIITEGEYDAIALKRIIDVYTKEDFKDYKPAVISIPNGSGGASRDLSRVLPDIRARFKDEDISLCFDDDAAGKKAVEEVCKLIPSVKSITLPFKDANECMIKGAGKAAFHQVTFNPVKPKNTRIVWGVDIHEQAKVKAEWGLSWPWKGMTDMTRGIRYGETIYIGAGEKMGKSEIVNALIKHLVVDHSLKVMAAKPEESNAKTYKLVNSKVTGKVFHDPKIEFDAEAYEYGGALIRDKLCMLNLYQNITWDSLKQDFTHAASLGVKALFLDPITNLTNGMATAQINEHLQGVSQELAALAKDLDVVIFIFCHLNKPPKEVAQWDRGGHITTNYFAGSSAMARSCNYAIGLEGNKNPELTLEERNMRRLVLLADREFGESGHVDLYWDHYTHLFNEVLEHGQ